MKLFKLATTAIALTATLASTAIAEELRFSSFEPPVAFLTKEVFPAWAKNVSEASNGEFSVKMFPGGTLGRSPAQQLQMVQDGVADVAFIVPGYNPGRFTGVTVGELPFVVGSAKAGSEALWKMFEAGKLEGDFDQFKIIGLFTTGPQGIASKPVINMPADLKGLNFRASSPNLLAAIDKMGAVAVGGITAPTIAESINRGLIAGSFNGWNALRAFRIMGAVENVLEVPMGTSPLMVVMNKGKYEAMSDAGKAAIDKFSGAAFSTVFGEAFDGQNARVRAATVEEGRVNIITPDQATLDAWKAATQPSIDAWVAETKDGAALLEAYRAALAE